MFGAGRWRRRWPGPGWCRPRRLHAVVMRLREEHRARSYPDDHGIPESARLPVERVSPGDTPVMCLN